MRCPQCRREIPIAATVESAAQDLERHAAIIVAHLERITKAAPGRAVNRKWEAEEALIAARTHLNLIRAVHVLLQTPPEERESEGAGLTLLGPTV